MGKFYKLFFPSGRHKLNQEDIDMAMATLKQSYSDDILSAVYLPQVEREIKKPSFPHPPNWDSLSMKEKANLLLCANFLKMLAIIDFCNMSVKEIQALDDEVQKFLNQDSRLDRNMTGLVDRPDTNKVKAEILKDKNKVIKHQNSEPDGFPEIPENTFKWFRIANK